MKKGFTLLESIITIFIFILAFGAAVGFVIWIYRFQSFTWEQSIAIEEARRGIETMVKEIREATYGENGAFPIEKADDKEFIFYSDIDGDSNVERVRYFLGTVRAGREIKECETSARGGNCTVEFSNFLKGTLKSAELKVWVDGDFGWRREYAEIFADGVKLGKVCGSGCSDCLGTWQGGVVFDVASQASDNFLQLVADATSFVDPLCPHSMKVKFELSFSEELSGLSHELRKGVIEATGSPAVYPLDQEKITILTSYVRNSPPIFEYFDSQGNKIEDYPARVVDTKLMKIFLVINVDPNRPPQNFELETWVKLRNLTSE